MLRSLACGLALVLLSSCGDNKNDKTDARQDAKKDDKVCCAVNPDPPCQAELDLHGVTREERAIVTAAGNVCPSAQLSEARLREIGTKWPEACHFRTDDLLHALNSGACAKDPK